MRNESPAEHRSSDLLSPKIVELVLKFLWRVFSNGFTVSL